MVDRAQGESAGGRSEGMWGVEIVREGLQGDREVIFNRPD